MSFLVGAGIEKVMTPLITLAQFSCIGSVCLLGGVNVIVSGCENTALDIKAKLSKMAQRLN